MISFLLALAVTISCFIAIPGILTASSSAKAAPDVDPSLLAWYTFEPDKLTSGESGSRKVLDSSGNGNDAAMYWSTGTFETVSGGIDGASLNFVNGTRASAGAYLQLPADILKSTDSYSISMWYKLTGAPANARLFNFDSVASGTRQAYITYTPYGNATKVEGVLESRASSSATAITMPFTGSSTTGEWVNLVVARDSKATRIYVNGSLYAMGAAGLSPLGIDFLGAYLGRSGDSSHNYFNGEIDDVRIYNRLLTPRDVMAQYRNYPAVSSLNTTPGAYLMSYTMPAGFTGYGTGTSAPQDTATQQMGIFDYSLHYAYSEDGKTWTPLNDNRGILYWQHDSAYNSTDCRKY
jgi:hypothetical protein